MAARTPVQSNVMGFEEILSGGETFMTPRNSLSSSNAIPHSPVVKTTTIIRESPDRSKRRTPRKSGLSICNKCGTCEYCEKRQRQQLSRFSSLRLQSPNISDTDKTTDSDVTSPFKPEFITGSQKQRSKQSKWETVKVITETIIKEKDMLIERQKLKRLQLEQQVRELEDKLRKALIAQNSTTDSTVRDDSAAQLEKEEQVYRQMTSSVNLLSDNNSLAKVMMEKAQLERQLGESEHKVADLKCSLLTQRSDLQQQVDYYKKSVHLSQEHEQALEMKNNNMKTEGDHASKELSRLKLYLADLPTKDEYNELASRLAQTDEDLNMNKEHIESLVDERSHVQEECRRLNDELGESNDQIVQLLVQVSLLQKELSVWEQKEMLRDTASDDDIVRLKEQQLELHKDYERFKQLSESQQHELDTVTREYEQQIDELSRQLEHSEMLLQAAQEEGSDKDNDIRSLSDTLQQTQAEKEELKEQVSSNEEKVRVAEDVISTESSRLEQSLVEEIVYCTSSLQCLVDMHENPNKLDLADMLATRPTPVTISSPREYVAVLEQQNKSMKSMNEKIEKLRQFILDKYADDMASTGHVDCATQ